MNNQIIKKAREKIEKIRLELVGYPKVIIHLRYLDIILEQELELNKHRKVFKGEDRS